LDELRPNRDLVDAMTDFKDHPLKKKGREGRQAAKTLTPYSITPQ
jgi:hypothetical protein